jgi:imidazolonepropionase-like amidohydrolase
MVLKAIVGAAVIDGTGSAPINDGVVLIEGGRIRSVATGADAVVPERAEVIDARGRYVIPGLMDANVHLFGGTTPDLVLEYEGRYAELVQEAAQIALRSGLTTVFDTWGPLEPLVDIRARINRGEVVGSRIFIAGNIIGFAGPLSPDFFPTGTTFGPDTVDRINRQWEQGVGRELMWLTPESIGRRVREYIERSSIDFVKYAASGHKDMEFLTFSEAAQRAIVEEGHRAGLTVQAHTTSVESLRMEIDAGADLLQHGDLTGPEPMPEEILKAIVDEGTPVAALVCTDRYMAWVREYGQEGLRRFVHNATKDENERRLIAAGARLLLTTDAFVYSPRVLNHPVLAPLWKLNVDSPTELGESHFLWLEAVIERGMTPMDALMAATRNIAKAYGQDHDLGTLEPGKRADLLILDADPLHDVHNYRRIVAVIKDGAVVNRNSLPTRRVLTEGSDDVH